jgi:hypothetical protein
MRRDGIRREDGVTMIEVVVSLTLMAVLMTVFTTAVIQVYRHVNQTEAISTAQANLNTVFLRLDKEVRYASGISNVPPAGADWYVEYLNTNRGTETCTQLRLTSTGLLQRRTWNRNQTPIQPSGWAVLASGIRRADGPDAGEDLDPPFTFVAANPANAASTGSNFHQLVVTLAADGPNRKQSAQSTFTFAALNTSQATTSTDVCVEGRAVA